MTVHMSEKIMRPDFQGEFTASILAAAASPDLISFAGGLPNPVSFPVEAMEKATAKVLAENGVQALQYSGTQGLPALRAWIAKRYETMGVYDVTADDIIITNGSQQALAMLGVCMIDPGDKVLVENPTYLVALQSFHMFDPKIIPVQMNPDGIDCEKLSETVKANPDAKFIYVIPNFQNPTGLSYTKEVHDKVVEILKGTDILVIEDNPYRELRFAGEATDSFGKELGEQCCMLGTFSKIVALGLRPQQGTEGQAAELQVHRRPAHQHLLPAGAGPVPPGQRCGRPHRKDQGALPRQGQLDDGLYAQVSA